MERMFNEELKSEEEQKQYSLFHKIKINFDDVELYSEEDRRLARLQPNFRREFGGEWGFGTGAGALFASTDLDKCVELGRRFANVRYNPDHAKRPYPYSLYSPEADTMIGVDTAGGSSSQFAICGLQIWDKHLHCFAAETYSRPNTDRMIDRILELWSGTGYSGTIYVDGSNPSFVRTLKQNMGRGERVDFEDHIEYLRHHGYAGYQDMNLSDYMRCVPVYFNTHGARLLQTASLYVQRHLLALHPDFKELIASMHSAKTREHAAHDWALDKSEFSHDILDAFRCALYDARIEKPKVRV